MEGAVIVRRVVAVKAVLHHLIDEPAVDPLVKMRRLHPEEDEPQKGAERDNRPGRPVNLGGARFQIGQPFSPGGKNC